MRMQRSDKEQSLSPRFTILTPSWNRKRLLGRLFASIRAQHDPSLRVEWLIVDDGSSDGTAAAVQRMQGDADFPVVYVRIDHGGKHRALNAGFRAARGNWIVIVDSDDRIAPGGMQAMATQLRKAEEQDAQVALFPMHRPGLARQFTFSEPGQAIPLRRCNAEEARSRSTLGFRRDTPGLRLDEFTGENYLAESSLIYALPPETLCYPSARTCVEVEFQPDGLSARSMEMRMACPLGATTTYRRMSNAGLPKALVLRAYLNFARFWWHGAMRGRPVLKPDTIGEWSALAFGLPLALRDVVILARDRRRHARHRPAIRADRDRDPPRSAGLPGPLPPE